MSDITHRRPISWRSFGLTDVGCVREVNEDSMLDASEKNFWAIADGMGGHQVGDVASKKVIDELTLIESQSQLSDYAEVVEDALLSANRQLLEYTEIMLGGRQSLGTTAVCLFIKKHVGMCMWVGDSRLYRFRNNSLQQLTVDHSQVEEMLQMGLITPQEAEVHPNKNVITRAVGAEYELVVDLNIFSVQVGDTFLLCSDGLYNAVKEVEMKQILNIRDADICAKKLMQSALDNKAHDNVSVIVVKGEPGRV